MEVIAGTPSIHSVINTNATSDPVLNHMTQEELENQTQTQTILDHHQQDSVPPITTQDSDMEINSNGTGLLKQAKTLVFVEQSFRTVLNSRINASSSVVDFMNKLGGIDNTYSDELYLHAKHLHNQYNSSVDNAMTIILNTRSRRV